MSYLIAVDSGGTFTDTVVLDPEGGVIAAKAPSTPDDFARGVLDSVGRAAELLGIPLSELLSQSKLFAHGTTVATNALLTRTGARTGLITTRGHEDALIIGRTIQKVAGRSESELTRLAELDKADPIVPRPLIRGIRERIDYKGEVIVPLNEQDVLEAARELVAAGCESLAVTYLWSFMHPEHERRTREIIGQEYPHLMVSLSHELAPVIKEYERTATTAINAYVGNVTGSYLGRLSGRLGSEGYRNPPLIMQSSGGVIPAAEAQQRAASLLVSGPAGGVIGAVALGEALGIENMITTDVGGTSFDVGLVVDGEPQFSLTPVYAQYHTVLPSIDISSIGAGGGSIAWIEPSVGLLKVGPQSAGADPGPVCYGAGGTEPTVTDANVVLNRLNPNFFLGGTHQLDGELARQAISQKIAAPLGLSVEEAALGIVNILDARMADLVRKVTIGRGYDPRNFSLLAFGGAGPLHVGAYAGDVGVQQIIIPAQSSEFSAWGIAVSDLLYLRQLSEPLLAPFPAADLNRIYALLEEEVEEGLRGAGVEPHAMSLSRSIDMRFRGQIHEVRVPVPSGHLTDSVLEEVSRTFHDIYNRKYGAGAAYHQAGVEARTFQIRGYGRIRQNEWVPRELGPENAESAIRDRRQIYFQDGFQLTPIYGHAALRPGHRLLGPALIEADDTTILLQPEQSLHLDEFGNSIMNVR